MVRLAQHVQGLDHAATAFLSYAREDVEEVAFLQRLLQLRGVRDWRDVTNLPLGRYSKDEIVQAITQESDVFVPYLTLQNLVSSFIWDVEIPAALQRRERDHAFNVVPILRDVTFAQVQRACAQHGFPSLSDLNGVKLPEQERDETQVAINQALQSIAEGIMHAALRLRRVSADAGYEPWPCLHTFPYAPATPSLDLDLNWTERTVHRALAHAGEVAGGAISRAAHRQGCLERDGSQPYQAHAIVHQIARELKRLYDREGVAHIHLFLSCPAALAVMLGHQLNALGAMTLYHYMEKQGLYEPVYTLG